MHTVEALDRLILFRQKPDSLLRRLMSSEEAVRVAAQGELVALAVEYGWQGHLWRCCIARELVSSENPFPSRGSGIPADRTHWKHWHWQI